MHTLRIINTTDNHHQYNPINNGDSYLPKEWGAEVLRVLGEKSI